MPHTGEINPVCKVSLSLPDMVDLIELLHQDLEIQNLTKIGKLRDWKVWQEPTCLILTRKGEEPSVWMVPESVKTDFIAFIYDQGHFGVEKSMDRLESFGW